MKHIVHFLFNMDLRYSHRIWLFNQIVSMDDNQSDLFFNIINKYRNSLVLINGVFFIVTRIVSFVKYDILFDFSLIEKCSKLHKRSQYFACSLCRRYNINLLPLFEFTSLVNDPELQITIMRDHYNMKICDNTLCLLKPFIKYPNFTFCYSCYIIFKSVYSHQIIFTLLYKAVFIKKTTDISCTITHEQLFNFINYEFNKSISLFYMSYKLCIEHNLQIELFVPQTSIESRCSTNVNLSSVE